MPSRPSLNEARRHSDATLCGGWTPCDVQRKTSLNDLTGAGGRMDVLVRALMAGLLTSHGLRRNTVVVLHLMGGPGPPRRIKFDGSELKGLHADERSIAEPSARSSPRRCPHRSLAAHHGGHHPQRRRSASHAARMERRPHRGPRRRCTEAVVGKRRPSQQQRTERSPDELHPQRRPTPETSRG
ncbi:MAG: hypothetical protein CM15mP78_09220 [Candidatus Poseidoniales archaeon]|nr:MAG: hypothetical protein CM15mP78_09220 [Candidatus Poseidoniales archaeon]